MPLRKLLEPKSIAVVGASIRPDTAGYDVVRQLNELDFEGQIIPINPKYDRVQGHECFRKLADVPSVPDMAVLCVANSSLERQVEEALAAGVKAITIFGSGYLDNDDVPALPLRLAAKLREAGVKLCGANSMGFFNFDQKVAASWLPISKRPAGGISFISHSGGIFASFLDLDFRLRFNLAVSAGQELTTTVADYMDYALDQTSTQVITLFIETVRDREKFIAALEKANKLSTPVIALKVGRTEMSAKLAESHSGAIAGNHAAYQALFRRHNVIEVTSIDEMAATALLLSSPRLPKRGDLAAILDSGGARGMLIDLASDLGVPLASIGEATRSQLKKFLAPGLEPVNPLDAWGTSDGFVEVFTETFSALMADEAVGAGLMVCDLPMEDYISKGFATAVTAVAGRSEKFVGAASNFGRLPRIDLVNKLAEAGIPFFDGIEDALRAIRNGSRWHSRRYTPAPVPVSFSRVRQRWLSRLAAGSLNEADSLDLLDDYGIQTVNRKYAQSGADVVSAARDIGFPVVIKTCENGIDHKSDVGGVRVNIRNEADLREAYADMSERLGPKVMITQMIPHGVELALGVVVDDQMGPILLVGAGGTLIELLRDVQALLCPSTDSEIHQALSELKVARLLEGHRGSAAAAQTALVSTAVKLSRLAAELSPVIREIDLNPIIVTATGAVAVDALVKSGQVKANVEN